MTETRTPAFQRLADLMIGAKIAIALRAAAAHGIADILADGPASSIDLASRTGLDERTLLRVLRALSQFDIFSERPDGRFENSDHSEFMRADAQPSLRDAILFFNHPVSLQPWMKLNETLKDGTSRFVEINGGPLFKLFQDDRQLSEFFGGTMRNLYGPEADKIATGFPFGEFGTIIDVGGGPGHILAAILARHPRLTGALLDNEPTALLARKFLGERGLEDRCTVTGGDFFEAVPGGYDAYMVKSVLHDWEDGECVDILTRCLEAMPDGAKLLIVEELIVPGRPVGNPHKFVDLDLMIHLNARERTEAEYLAIAERAGFRHVETVPIEASFFSVVVLESA